MAPLTQTIAIRPLTRLLGRAALVWLLVAGAAGNGIGMLAGIGEAQAQAVEGNTAAAAGQAPDPMQAGAIAIVQRYPEKSIASVPTANAALAEVAHERTEIDTRYRAAQLACRPVFFMARCLDAAKEKRRSAMAMLRPVEIEANAYKRRDKVVERDRVLDVKKEKAERDAATEQNSVKIRKPISPANPPAGPQDTPSGAVAAPAAPHAVRTPHVAKPLTPSIDAATEARNMASYDRKAVESAQRQKEIAAKKAEKEQDRARKKAEADAAAAAAQNPPPAK